VYFARGDDAVEERVYISVGSKRITSAGREKGRLFWVASGKLGRGKRPRKKKVIYSTLGSRL